MVRVVRSSNGPFLHVSVQLQHAPVFRASLNRPNIFYKVNYSSSSTNDMDSLFKAVQKAITGRDAGSAIIYCLKRENATDLSSFLEKKGEWVSKRTSVF